MPELFAHLLKSVIRPGLCLGCGTCVGSCPFLSLEFVEGVPTLKRRCEACGICFAQCPHVGSQAELERAVFGRNAEEGEPAGIVEQAFSVRARDADILARCQDGGAVTALLAALLEGGFIDGAVVMGVGDSPWLPAPKVATTREELLACAGTKYARGPLTPALRDAADLYARERVAVVGTPCQIKAMRRMRSSELAAYRLGERVGLCIGLFCWQAFSYKGLFEEELGEKLRIPLAEVVKFDIKRGKFVAYFKGKPKRELPLESLTKHACPPCKLCVDFSAELADISVGAAGSPPDHSTVLLRTPAGIEAFEFARKARVLDIQPLERVRPGLGTVKELSLVKKRAALAEIERRRKSGEPLPPGLT